MRYLKHKRNPEERYQPHWGFAVPFLVALAVLTVVSFIIPLRPTRSYSEKRSLAQFPEFSWETVLSGDYFDDITTWFSDTFPGRDSWIQVTAKVEEFYGQSDIVIHGDVNVPAADDQNSQPSGLGVTGNMLSSGLSKDLDAIVMEETTPPTDPVEVWGGLDAGTEEVSLGAAIQIGDTAFTYFSYTETFCSWYASVINRFAETMEGTGVNIVSAVAPTAIGVMVENEYMTMLGCEPQDEALDLINSQIREDVYTIDTVRTLIKHNDEYLFYRTDHHWSALGAYYIYEAICQELGYEPAPLDSFTEWDQGEFKGSLYYQCKQSNKLRADNVIAYVPDDEIHCMLYNSNGGGFEWPMLTDMTRSDVGSKYMTFLAGDHALAVLTNENLPDAPNCVLLKNSYGNCLAPFLTQNYHKVYVVDYRKYSQSNMSRFIEKYDIQDIIILPSMDTVQSSVVMNLLSKHLK